MATIAFSKTISAAHMARAVPALKAHFGLPPSASNAETEAEWQKSVWAQLVGIVKNYEAETAAKTARDAVTEVALT